MIILKRHGKYKLIETKKQIKILYLDNDIYAWIQTEKYGEMLVASYRDHKTDCVLGMGNFYIYQVVDEPLLADHIHLELEAGKKIWQGYLLLSGLPDKHKERGRIIPTNELITGNPRYARRKDLRVNLAASR